MIFNINPHFESCEDISRCGDFFKGNFLNGKSIRTFIAIEVPDSFKAAPWKVQDDLRRFRCRVSWTKSAGMHLTLKFLGDTDEGMVDEIGEALEKSAGSYHPFEIKLGSPGVFGGRNPRVLWLGLEAPQTLFDLVKAVEEAMFGLGFAREKRKFHPHLTLGRVKEQAGAIEMADYFKALSVDSEVFTVYEIVLFRSDLKPSGAVYTPLKRVSLNQG